MVEGGDRGRGRAHTGSAHGGKQDAVAPGTCVSTWMPGTTAERKVKGLRSPALGPGAPRGQRSRKLLVAREVTAREGRGGTAGASSRLTKASGPSGTQADPKPARGLELKRTATRGWRHSSPRARRLQAPLLPGVSSHGSSYLQSTVV